MDTDAVNEFLGCVPLLQRLPSSSLKKIAELVTFKHYDSGEYIVREGEAGNGVYFIWEGEAEVSGPINVEEDGDPEFLLKKYDYFGHGLTTSFQQANVNAVSKLTCLMLPLEHCPLLQPKSFWSADKTLDSCSRVEHILHLDQIEVDIFKGITLPDAPRFGRVFGGQLVGQALAAASKSLDALKIVHSLHAYFLLEGDLNLPIIYEVHRLRDGKSFGSRRVNAIQKGNVIFTLMASFQKEEEGFDHQVPTMPSVPDPESLLSMEELRERRLTDPRLPMNYRNKVATKGFVLWPIEIRFCEPNNATNQTKSPPSLRYWFRSKGKLSDDQALHRCVVAYASDLIMLSVSLNPHRRLGMRSNSASLDHSMWFHRSLRADDWLLYVVVSPSSYNGRGFVSGQMFNRKGELVVSLTQEGVTRKAKTPPVVKSKL